MKHLKYIWEQKLKTEIQQILIGQDSNNNEDKTYIPSTDVLEISVEEKDTNYQGRSL